MFICSMKKLLLLIISVGSVLHASAQVVNSLQGQPESAVVNSMSLRLEKLQHDYDFMYCDFQMHKVLMDLKDLSHSIDISSNGALINFYNSRYDYRMYKSYLDSYTSSYTLYESLKESVDVVKAAVFVRIDSSTFTEDEKNLLISGFVLIQKAVTKVERSLEYYDTVIKAYKSKA